MRWQHDEAGERQSSQRPGFAGSPAGAATPPPARLASAARARGRGLGPAPLVVPIHPRGPRDPFAESAQGCRGEGRRSALLRSRASREVLRLPTSGLLRLRFCMSASRYLPRSFKASGLNVSFGRASVWQYWQLLRASLPSWRPPRSREMPRQSLAPLRATGAACAESSRHDVHGSPPSARFASAVRGSPCCQADATRMLHDVPPQRTMSRRATVTAASRPPSGCPSGNGALLSGDVTRIGKDRVEDCRRVFGGCRNVVSDFRDPVERRHVTSLSRRGGGR